MRLSRSSGFSVGIDEAGRGPLAGPVSVGVVIVSEKFNPTSPRLRGASKRFFRGIKDSKKLSEHSREEWFEKAEEAKEAGDLNFAVALVGEKTIDQKGIVESIKIGIQECLDKLKVPKHSKIFLDGSLCAPKEFKHQKTIIKGDEKVALISLASIMAKVTRDRYMVRLSKKYPEYGFEIHKGYGTFKHREAIKKFGASKVHRKSYLTNLK